MKTTLATSLAMFASGVSIVSAQPLEVVGTGDGMELVRAVGKAFNQDHPGIVVVVPPSIGSGGGIAAVGAGKSPLARVARPLKPAEEQSGLVAYPVFRLPSAIYVHQSLNLSGITSGQLSKIYDGSVTNWRDVGGPDQRIKVVRREDTDSTLSVLRASMPGWSALELTARSKIAMTTQDAVSTVESTKGAIGFGPYSKALEQRVDVLRIDGLHPMDAGFPSAVTVSYVWRKPLERDDARAFVEYAGGTTARGILRSYGAIPMQGGALAASPDAASDPMTSHRSASNVSGG